MCLEGRTLTSIVLAHPEHFAPHGLDEAFLNKCRADLAKTSVVAGELGLPYARGRLTNDWRYNATLGTAYLASLQEEFGRSPVMVAAGYNAGPGRARYWIGKSGDPRDPSVDPVDWIELIHLEETREYVKKVMANLQIYRARLGKPETALQISKDIERGTF